MASNSGFSKMRFIEVFQAQMKLSRPEITSALLMIVPYARPASEIPFPLLGFGREFNRRETKRVLRPQKTTHPFKHKLAHSYISITLVNIHAEFQGVGAVSEPQWHRTGLMSHFAANFGSVRRVCPHYDIIIFKEKPNLIEQYIIWIIKAFTVY